AFEFDKQLLHLFRNLLFTADKGESTAAKLSCFTHKVTVRCGAYTDRKQARILQLLMNKLEQLSFVTDAAVSDKNHLLEITRRSRIIERGRQCSTHFGTALGPQLLHKTSCLPQFLFARRLRC